MEMLPIVCTVVVTLLLQTQGHVNGLMNTTVNIDNFLVEISNAVRDTKDATNSALQINSDETEPSPIATTTQDNSSSYKDNDNESESEDDEEDTEEDAADNEKESNTILPFQPEVQASNGSLLTTYNVTTKGNNSSSIWRNSQNLISANSSRNSQNYNKNLTPGDTKNSRPDNNGRSNFTGTSKVATGYNTNTNVAKNLRKSSNKSITDLYFTGDISNTNTRDKSHRNRSSRKFTSSNSSTLSKGNKFYGNTPFVYRPLSVQAPLLNTSIQYDTTKENINLIHPLQNALYTSYNQSVPMKVTLAFPLQQQVRLVHDTTKPQPSNRTGSAVDNIQNHKTGGNMLFSQQGANRQSRTSAGKSIYQSKTPIGKTVSQTRTPIGNSVSQSRTPTGKSISQSRTPIGKTVSQTRIPIGNSVSQPRTPSGKSVSQSRTPIGNSVSQSRTPSGKSVSQSRTPIGKSVESVARNAQTTKGDSQTTNPNAQNLPLTRTSSTKNGAQTRTPGKHDHQKDYEKFQRNKEIAKNSKKQPDTYTIISNEQKSKPIDYKGNGKIKTKKVNNKGNNKKQQNKRVSNKVNNNNNNHNNNNNNNNKSKNSKTKQPIKETSAYLTTTPRSNPSDKPAIVDTKEGTDETKIALKLGLDKNKNKNKNKDLKPKEGKKSNKKKENDDDVEPPKKSGKNKGTSKNRPRNKNKKIKNKGKGGDDEEDGKSNDENRGVTLEDGYEGIVKIKKPHKNKESKEKDSEKSKDKNKQQDKATGNKNKDDEKNKEQTSVLKLPIAINRPTTNNKTKNKDNSDDKSESEKTEDRKKPDDVNKTQDREKPDDVNKTQDREKPDDVNKTQDRKKPDDGNKTQDGKKPDDVNKTQDREKPDDGNKTQDRKKPDDVNKTQDRKKPDDVNKTQDRKKPDDGNKTQDGKKPDDVNKTQDREKPDDGNKTQDRKKPDDVNKTQDRKKPDEGNKTQDGKKPDDVNKTKHKSTEYNKGDWFEPDEDIKLKSKKQDDSAEKVVALLSKLRFMNGASGRVAKEQLFSYVSQCGLYTEPQNVSTVQRAWVTKTYSPYFYLYEKPKNYEQCKPSEWLHDKEMRGSVFLSFEVKSLKGSNMTNNAKICEKYCCKEPRCNAWTLRFQEATTSNCPENSFCCWLKNSVPPVEDHEAAISGVVHRKNYKHPPTGMRSSVPLGGLGTGSFEMRADGTFHEWTIENQSPGGSAKLGKTALEKFFLGARVAKGKNEPVSAILKTHVPNGFENDSVVAMEYFGSHPVSKFDIELSESLKEDIDMKLFAYSSFHPRNEVKAATPAVSFSMLVKNPSKDDTLDVSFMLNLPFGYNEDTIRKGSNYQEKQFSRLVKPEDCMHACAERTDCQAWTTNGPYTCMLKDEIPLHSYDYGIISGIRGNWSLENGMLNCERPGYSPQSGSISLYPIQSGSEVTSFTVSDDIENLWKGFKRTGDLTNATKQTDVNSTGLHGAVSISTKLKPSESKVLTIIFAWYFPNRDIADERVGNFYSNLFQSSNEVAKQFVGDLDSSLEEIVQWQSVMFPPASLKDVKKEKDRKSLAKRDTIEPTVNCTDTLNDVNILPSCLQDIMVNSMSFLRTGMWMEDGRWRQWEAFDCANMDPVHIDFHRILPYMIFYPELVKQIMLSWASHQLSNVENGMIQESLSVGCLEETSKEGIAGGRLMADVNVAFIAQAYLIQIWTNDTDFFDAIYPYTVRAAQWLMKRATKNTELPFRKQDTYDLFELDKYDHCAYNSILYFLALRVMKKMAVLKKDTKTLNDVTGALERGEKRFDIEFWDEKKGFYHAWFDDEWGSPSWLMTDILYGQVWAYTLGVGDLVDRDKMESHLKKEVDRNDSPFGLKVMTKSEESNEIEDTSVILGEELHGCKSLENITKTNSVWMSSSTDWSTLQLYLGMKPQQAMQQAIKSLDNYRTNLRDLWNIHGITSSSHYGLDGLPWATSHYTLHLVLWHLPIALSGQQYYAPNGTLTFQPKYDAPYWLPFYTPICMGNIEAKETNDERVEVLYSLKVSSGTCRFNELSISNVRYSEPIDLSVGDQITWSAPKISKKEMIKSILDQLKH